MALSDSYFLYEGGMSIRKLAVSAAVGLIVGCSSDNDGVSDANLLERVGREAICVASAERLQLYDIARKHRKHGERSETKYLREVNGKDEDRSFEKKMGAARAVYADMSKEFHAMYLTNACGEKIPIGYIKNIK